MLNRDEILREFAKCITSPIYAIETYLSTFDKTQEGFVAFKLFPRQKEIIHCYQQHKHNLVTKPRQAGVSTTTAGFLSVKVAFADPKNPEAVLIIANKQELAFEFLDKVKEFVNQMPRWVWGPEYYGSEENEARSLYTTKSRKEIKLPNGSRVKAVATSKGALRGFTPTYLIMDEAAHIENGAEVFGAAFTALGTGGRSVLISTPNGLDELYYKTYEQSKMGRNDFHVIELKWYEDLRYNKDLSWIRGEESIIEIEFTFDSYARMIREGYKPTSSWYEQMCRGMNNDERMIAQELDVSFLGSGGNVINHTDIEMQEKLNVQVPEYVSGPDKEIWIWKQPEEGHKYAAGVDVSRGDGEDSSTIVIVDFTTMEEVMEYQGKIKPDELAQLVEEYCNHYNAYTIVDITGGMGATTVLKLLEFEFKHLHYDTPNGKVLSSKQKKLQETANKDNKIPGLQVGNARIQMISNLEEKIRTNAIKVRSSRMIAEMKTFVYKDGRPDHMKGAHDDLLMSLAMVLWVLEHSFKNLEKLEKQTKAILGSWLNASVDNNSTQTTNKKIPQRPHFSPHVARNMQDPTGQYMWLFSKKR